MLLALSALLAMILQPSAQDIRDHADAANEAYISCLFSEVRAARTQRLSVAAFRSRFDGSCRAEQAAARRTFVPALELKGVENPSAIAERLLLDSRRNIGGSYLGPPAGEERQSRVDPGSRSPL